MFVKTARCALLWMLGLLCACSMAGAADAPLPPLDAAYIDVDPAAQRVLPLDAEDAAVRSGLEALLRREPRNALARLQFAQLQLDRGLRARVARELDSAERFSEPGSELRRRVHFNAGWILFRMGDFAGARAQWTQAWQQHGGHPDWVPVAFALTLWSQGDREGGLAYFRAELAARPTAWATAEAVQASTGDLSAGDRFALQSMRQALAEAR
jgi:hypothetical protein